MPSENPAPTWISASGLLAHLRPIAKPDRQRMQRAFARLSADEIRARFLHPLKMLSDEHWRQLIAPNSLALGLFATLSGRLELIASVRAQLDPEKSSAEFALVVPSALTQQGLGTWLMRRLIDELQQRHIGQLSGDIGAENHPMLKLARKLGFELHRHPDDAALTRVSMSLVGASLESSSE